MSGTAGIGTHAGNLAADPGLRFTAAGADYTVAVKSRVYEQRECQRKACCVIFENRPYGSKRRRIMSIANAKAAANLDATGRMIGPLLATLIIGGAIAVHVWAVFFADWSAPGMLLATPFVIALETWLYVGIFIVAHDAMHGTLVPRNARLNHLIGRIALTLYAGFSYKTLMASHHDHHRYAGTPSDPDFDAAAPRTLLPWYFTFFRRYFHLRQLLSLAALVVVYVLVFRVSIPAVLVFWALPAILSSVQLFYFGTYRPHRVEEEQFTDRHNARSLNFGFWISLLTCFHFGYHHEHHDKPWIPWWKLPAYREA